MKTSLNLSRQNHAGPLPSGGACNFASKTLSLAGLSITAALLPLAASAQLSAVRDKQADRVELADVLGGDFGISGASLRAENKNTIDISKFGGAGDVGDPQPLFDLPIKWQPR